MINEVEKKIGPLIALALGLAGLIPFVYYGYYSVFAGEDNYDAASNLYFLFSYGAVILSFLGGARWGMALNKPCRKQPIILVVAVVPSLVGWYAANFLPIPIALHLLLAAFLVHGVWDFFAVRRGAGPSWYGNLRVLLTVIVCAIHVAVILGLTVYRTEMMDLPAL